MESWETLTPSGVAWAARASNEETSVHDFILIVDGRFKI